MRRKLLKKNLSAIAKADVIDEVFSRLGIDPNSRAEELEPEMFSRLFQQLH
jgi:16S rRNA A1518/A1519 N6-dimethyltransferase RsmA/KsgA/DIM1 with predicted DNA glycosylase/AP lyase activity